MKEHSADVIVVGGGPSGLAAACTCRQEGLGRTLLIEREPTLGGILPQCIHTGFGLREAKEDLTGPEFAEMLIGMAKDNDVEMFLNTYALRMNASGMSGISIECASPRGIEVINASCLIYSTGCRERNVSEIGIVGDRPSGVLTAGTAQTLMDLYGLLPGREVVVIGSGDIGLIMSRRFALEGARVRAVVEILPYPGGLMRNVVQCLEDFDIPLLLSHAVIEIRGGSRVESVVIVEVDDSYSPKLGTEKVLSCDTVIIAAGLVPEVGLLENVGVSIDPSTGGPIVNEYLETSIPGIFASGNVLLVNDLVDNAVEQGRTCGRSAKRFLEGDLQRPDVWKRAIPGEGLRLLVPQLFSGMQDAIFYARVKRPMRDCRISMRELPREVRVLTARPAEMIRIQLNGEVLSRVDTSLTFEVISG